MYWKSPEEYRVWKGLPKVNFGTARAWLVSLLMGDTHILKVALYLHNKVVKDCFS